MRKTRDTTLRYLSLLQLIPTSPITKSVSQINSQLADLNNQFKVSPRTTQRDLITLSRIFKIRDEDDGNKKLWCWSDYNAYTQFPEMGKHQAIAFLLADEYLNTILPPELLDTLSVYIAKAKSVLSKTEYSDLGNRIMVINSGPSMHHPEISPEAKQHVFDSLLSENKLEIDYANAEGYISEKITISPVGLVVKNSLFYLIALNPKGKARQYALHRMSATIILEQRFKNKFDLNFYVENDQEFSYPVTKTQIELRLLINNNLTPIFNDSRLSTDQRIILTSSSYSELTASVADNQDLRWWLLSFGDQVEVLEPLTIRNEMAKIAINLTSKYFDGITTFNGEKNMQYYGELEVVDEEFELTADQFILRDGEISFRLSGSDDYGQFKVEGLAIKSKEGFYLSPKLPVHYREYSDPEYVSIRFNAISSNEKICIAQGVWIEGADSWSFSGDLLPKES